MEEKIDKKIVAKIAQKKLKSGKTKQEVYDELVDAFKYRNDVADVLAQIPTNARWKKYGFWNTLFLIFLCIITTILLIQPTIGLIWMGWVIYVVAARKFKLYYWNILLGFMGVIAILGVSFYQGSILWTDTIISVVLSLILILGGVYLPKLLTPAYKEVREPYLNAEGERRIVVKHDFPE